MTNYGPVKGYKRQLKRHNDPRYEKFAQLLAGGVHYVEAYQQAGFPPAEDFDKTRKLAWRLRRNVYDRVCAIMGIAPPSAMPRNDDVLKTVQSTLIEFQKDVPWCREKLHELINDKDCPHATRLNAIRECLNRGLGLPIQHIEQNVNVRYQLSDRELTEDEWFEKYAKPVTAIPGPGNGSTEH